MEDVNTKKTFFTRRKINTMIASTLAFVIMGTTLAYFTDYQKKSIQGTAGTLKLVSKDGLQGDLNNIDMGQTRVITYEIESTGTIGMETRLSAFVMSEDTSIKKGVSLRTYVNGVSGDIIANLNEIEPDRDVASLGTYKLNGTKEIIDESVGRNKVYTFALVTDSDGPDELHGQAITIKVVAEGRQYTNAHNEPWKELTSQTFELKGQA